MPIHPDAVVDPSAICDDTVTVWAGTYVRERARIGQGTTLGQYVYVGPGTVIGSNCKVQNGAMIYEPAVVGDGVFIGPRVVFTNDRHPRAITPDGQAKTAEDWTPVGVTVEYGAAIGAGAICVAPIVVGSWACVAAGAVVIKDVAAYALVAGVPARRVGWVGRTGEPLLKSDGDGRWLCPSTGDEFEEADGGTSLNRVSL